MNSGECEILMEIFNGFPIFVGVAVGAQARRGEAERGGAGIGDVVDPVAVDAGRHVRVAVDEGVAVDAPAVLLVDRVVAAVAGLL